MAGTGFLGKLKQFDAYPKTLEDFRIKTYGGAASKLEMNWCLACVSFSICLKTLCSTVTLVSAAIISILFLSELAYFLSTDVSVYLFYIDAYMHMCVSASIHLRQGVVTRLVCFVLIPPVAGLIKSSLSLDCLFA